MFLVDLRLPPSFPVIRIGSTWFTSIEAGCKKTTLGLIFDTESFFKFNRTLTSVHFFLKSFCVENKWFSFFFFFFKKMQKY